MILLKSSIFFLLCGIICCQESGSVTPKDDPKRLQPANQDQANGPEDSPKLLVQNAASLDGNESQAKMNPTSGSTTNPAPTPTSFPFRVRRRKCCDLGREHFYMNGNCANRPKMNETGPWCEEASLGCCLFLEEYYMGAVKACNDCQNKPHKSRLPSTTEPPRVTDPAPTPTAVPFRVQRRKCCEHGREHFYMNGNCANRPKMNETGPWCEEASLGCCLFSEEYYMGAVKGCNDCQNKHDTSQIPSTTEIPRVTVPAPTPTPTNTTFRVRRRKCCDHGRQHFRMNGNCANRPKMNETGPWCEEASLGCCLFSEEYYMGAVKGCNDCQNKPHQPKLPSTSKTPRVTSTATK